MFSQITVVGITVVTAVATQVEVVQKEVAEMVFEAQGKYSDPYNQIDFEGVFHGPGGEEWVVPGFWAGGKIWKLRFAAESPGEYHYETRARQGQQPSQPDRPDTSDWSDSGLSGRTGRVVVVARNEEHPLLSHGRLRVAADKRHFEQADGTPFFWLGDTWWMGLSTRLDWPDGFQWLAQDRIQKGFNVIQIIAGPYPDMDVWDPRGQSEAGFPFTENFASINPEHYNLADQKFAYLVESGLTPCIVGMWGYYLPQLGVDKIKRYWRYLIARYGAYPVVWCIAGEATMPYYLSENKDAEGAQQREGWTEVMRYVRDTDPFHNIITIHPTQFGRDQVSEPELLSFDMLQTGHSDLETVPNVITTVRRSLEREPPMPVVNGEVNYEGILGRAWQNIQRLCFYHTVMNGAAGHTYGANGIWQFNGDDKPYGPSPHGRAWGNTPWREAAALPGSAQLGRGAALWRTLPWWEMRPHPEWVKTSKEPDDPYGTVCAGIPERLRVIYSPMAWDAPTVLGVESSVRYTAMYFDPVKGEKIDLGEVKPDANGSWTPPLPPEVHDWLLILNAES